MQAQKSVFAIVLIVIAASLAPVGDMFAKMLAVGCSALFICFGRYAAGGTIGLVLLVVSGKFQMPALRELSVHSLRAGLLASSIICLIGALKHAPLADVMAGFYLSPVISTGLSAAVLGERLPPLKALGSGLALFGAIAILDPTGAFNLGGALAICSGFMFAIYLISAKLAPEEEDGPSAAVVQSLIIALGTAPFALTEIASTPQWWMIGIFALIGAISIACQGATLVAYRWAEASTLAPFFYTALVSSIALGFFVLDEPPTPSGLLGILAITTGGILVATTRTEPVPVEAEAEPA